MDWKIQTTKVASKHTELIEILLMNREIDDRGQFLKPTSPLDITLEDVGINSIAVATAVERLKKALEQKEPIVIYGDYDADGVCATAILWETMYTLGFNVTPFIPHRERHGYGLSQKGIDEIFAKQTPAILISVDNGIVAHKPWQTLADAGIYTILTDHHEPDSEIPPAQAIIHTTKLCGATVAWMFAKAIAQSFPSKTNGDSVDNMLDLCAIATIADQVILTGANRSFARFGLEQLRKTKRLGLELLIESAGLKKSEIDTYGVNFGIAPRINAMGRLESALDALRALCTKKEAKARELIGKLQDTNRTRQDLTQEMIAKAMSRADEWKDEHIIIIEDTDFHEGVIGLIAGKLTETFHKPTIALSVGTQTAKGSARSVSGVHITNLLREFAPEYLIEIGGHPLAAGLKIETAKIAIFKEALYARARTVIDAHQLRPLLDIDCVLPTTLLSLETAKEIQRLAPFGSGNREPLFQFDAVQVINAKLVGKEGKHLKLSLKIQNLDQTVDGMAFGKGQRIEEVSSGRTIAIAGHLSINEWKGKQSLQIMIRDLKA